MRAPKRVNPNVQEAVLLMRHSKARRIKPLAEVVSTTRRALGPVAAALTKYSVTSRDQRTYTYATDGSIRRTDESAGVRGKAAVKAAKRLRHRGGR
jgi:hypothetical protein